MQIDELKYSLRSVEKYLPWINHIFIVTNKQVPRYLNTNHPKITIVDHSQIIPSKYLSVFNSVAIETAIHKIKGLSEHFLLANDDMFLNRFLDKDFFFENGKPILRFERKKKLNYKYTYIKTLVNAVSLIERDFGKISFFSDKNLLPHHNIDAYLKSDYKACAEHFEKEFNETLSHRFRNNTDIQRMIVSVWSFLKGRAKLKFYKEEKTAYQIDSLYLTNRNKNILKYLSYYDPALFCINDNEHSKPEDRKEIRKFLKDYFPWKSKFEL